MNRVVVLNLVGLSERLLGESTPYLNSRLKRWGYRKIRPILPALTCSAQATYLTGSLPSTHGIVGNGWYYRELSQVHFWKQSNRLVSGEKIWETALKIDRHFTCANLFWWFNLYSTVNFSVTPRPIYRADGLKFPDLDTEPGFLREELKNQLGPFPLHRFWGPFSDLGSTQWIADCARLIEEQFCPTLSLVYLPHLDYCLQREGPRGKSIPVEMRKVDRLVGALADFYSARQVKVVILSEYGISEVHSAVPLNQFLRRKGYLKVRTECGEDHWEAGASAAFAVCDHQIAQIYVQNPELLSRVRNDLEQCPGVEKLLDRADQASYGLAHSRSGDLVAVAAPGFWFSYEFWLDERRAPDYAKTVDIHRKPGYDPAELFLEGSLFSSQVKIAKNLIKKNLGFRTLMDLVPLHGKKVRGSHGRSEVDPQDYPIFISSDLPGNSQEPLNPLDIKDLLLAHLFNGREKEIHHAELQNVPCDAPDSTHLSPSSILY